MKDKVTAIEEIMTYISNSMTQSSKKEEVIKTLRNWIESEKIITEDSKLRIVIDEIEGLETQNAINAKTAELLKTLLKRHITVKPKQFYKDPFGRLISFMCPRCKGQTIMSFATEYYHCSKCGQKIQLYDQMGYWALGAEKEEM